MHRFGAADAWLMFMLWMSANGHTWGAIVAFVMQMVYLLTKPRYHDASAPQPQQGEDNQPKEN